MIKKENIKDGLVETFHENGQLWRRGNYINGEVEGLSEEFYENGQLSYRGNFKDGIHNGLFEWFHENGQLSQKTNLINGLGDGLTEKFDEDGNLTRTEEWKDGVLQKSLLHPVKKEFTQEDFLSSREWIEVKKLSESFFKLLSDPKIIERIDKVNQPGISSHLIQDVITEESEKLGFKSERNGLFSNYRNSKLRPDFHKKIFNTGVIIEVEKGQTNLNNNDLKDFWKCHICDEVNYLFLFVPQVLIQNEDDRWRRSKRPFSDVCNHMSSFFEPQNYTNVRGVVVYGY